MQRQCVDRACKPVGEHTVDPLVTLDAALTRELLCHQHYFKMGFGVRRDTVAKTLIFHSKLTWLESSLERCCDIRLDCHTRVRLSGRGILR